MCKRIRRANTIILCPLLVWTFTDMSQFSHFYILVTSGYFTNVLVRGLLSHNYCKLGNLRTAEIHCSQSEGWKSKIRVPAWWGPSSGLQMADFSSYPQVAEGARELPQASFISGLIPFITSQRSRLPIPSPRGFNKWSWQRHKRSVYSNK